MPDTHGEPPAPRRTPRGRAVGTGGWIGAACVWGVLGLCVGMPVVMVMAAALRADAGLGDAALSGPRLVSLARTLAYAALIGVLAVALAWPVATVIARARAVWLVVVATPMLLPSYLAYAGWSIARAPTTPLGRWIGAAPDHGMAWAPGLVSRALAVWGLALWAWPLASVVMAAGLRAVDGQVRDSLRLERAGVLRRARTLARAAWPSVLAAWGLIALLMLGSAVPLHVARIETYAIRVWIVLDEHPAEPWRAWVVAWPLVAIALLAGWVVSGRLARAGRGLAAIAGEEAPIARARPLAIGIAAVPWLLALVVPFGLFWSTMGGPGAIGRLFDRAGVGLATSAGVGAVVGVLAALLVLASAQSTGAARGRLGSMRIALGLAMAWGLLPGVLVGSATAQAARLLPDPVAESVIPMIVAHLSRWAFLPLLVGVWLGTSEAGGIAETRLLDGALGAASWARTSLRSAIGPTLAVGLACACLSFHEIESSVQVQPPGIDHMAQRLLQWLHYERMGELSAAGVLLLGVGILLAVLVVAASGVSRIRTSGSGRR